jgi:hypothetical protein
MKGNFLIVARADGNAAVINVDRLRTEYGF